MFLSRQTVDSCEPLTIVRTDSTALNQATTLVMAIKPVSLVNIVIGICSLIFPDNAGVKEEAHELHILLCEFADVFSEGSRDFGRTDVVKHRIDTGAAVPIPQPPRRLPLSKEEVERAVQDMNR